MYVVGGLIVGNPDDTRESIEANLTFARQLRRLAVHPASDAVSGHADDEGLPRRGLIVNEPRRGVRRDDGRRAEPSTCDAEEIEFMRWRAERWMKVRHMPAALRHDPGFVLRNGVADAARTRSAAATWRTWLGLEDLHAAFKRYREIRRKEREYLPDAGDHPTERFGTIERHPLSA